jgi:broad specificity phosphatase PhoE
MRIILIRHAHRANNLLREASIADYIESRTEDSNITEKGEKEAIITGRFLKKNNFKIDKCKKLKINNL